MRKYARIATGLMLIYSAIMLVLSQEIATRHLVESEILGWQTSRLVVFFLPGFQVIIGLIMILRLSFIRYINWVLLLVLIVHLIDLISWFMDLSEHDSMQYYHRLLFDPKFKTGPYLLLPLYLINLSFGIQVGKEKLKRITWFVYLFFLPLLGIGILHSKIYYTDFLKKETDLPEEFSVEKLRQATGVTEERALIIFFDPACHECQNVARDLSVMNALPKTSIHPIFQVDSAAASKFISSTGIKASYHLIASSDFYAFAHGVPNAYLVEGDKLIAHRTGYYINYRFFDLILD